jgi:serine protease Do
MLVALVMACASPSAHEGAAPRSPEAPGAASAANGPEGGTARPVDGASGGKRADLRELTVVVRVKPPAALAARYRELAKRYTDLEKFFLAVADGAFGSGFVVVRREVPGAPGAPSLRPFVVTNLHVLELSASASISFEGSSEAHPASVVYVDPSYDLAVLAFDAPGAPVVSEGLEIELSPAKDQEPVVASGYPGIGNEPSYQVTRGYVSNERFRMTEGGREQIYVQHTAPIDPGSSGGPLTTEQGKLLGVNTLKVRRRENVGLAIPSAVVAEALDRAVALPLTDSPPTASESSLSACETLAKSLARGEEGLSLAERSIGAEMVARDGFASLGSLPRDGADWGGLFVENPTAVFVYAIALRLMGTAAGSGSNGSVSPCVLKNGAAAPRTASFGVRLKGGERTWTFAWEQRRWKLVEGSLTGPAAGETFLRGIGAKGQRKKWKPSLR